MPLLKKNKPAPAEEAEATVEAVSREEYEALQAQVTELSEKLDALIEELNKAGEDAPADAPAEDAPAEDAPADAPADDNSGEVNIPTVEEIKSADDDQLKEWRKTLFDASDAKRPLAEIKKELLEVAKAAEAGSDDPAPSDDAPADDAPADDAPADDDPPADDDGEKKGTNGNVFGLIQDKKTKLVANEKMKPILQCATDKDKVIRLANTYACFFDEKKCLCKTGDKKAIAECWKEYLNDAETKKLLAKEKASKSAPSAPAKKPLLKKK